MSGEYENLMGERVIAEGDYGEFVGTVVDVKSDNEKTYICVKDMEDMVWDINPINVTLED